MFAIGNSLPSEDVKEDGQEDVLGEVSGVLDDFVNEEEDDTEVLGAVGGKHESDSGSFDGITENGGSSFESSASFIDSLGFVNEGEELSFGNNVVAVLLEDFNLSLNGGLDGLKSFNGTSIISHQSFSSREGIGGESASDEGDKNKSLWHLFRNKYVRIKTCPI